MAALRAAGRLERVRDGSWESVVGQLIGHYEKVARSRTLVPA